MTTLTIEEISILMDVEDCKIPVDAVIVFKYLDANGIERMNAKCFGSGGGLEKIGLLEWGKSMIMNLLHRNGGL